jgi:hypothetical protein
MHDSPLASSAGGSRQRDVKAPGALLTSKSIGRQRLFTASSVDGEIIAGSAATIATTATANMADPSGYFDLADRLLTDMPKTVLLLVGICSVPPLPNGQHQSGNASACELSRRSSSRLTEV